jgi:hypothetical protein
MALNLLKVEEIVAKIKYHIPCAVIYRLLQWSFTAGNGGL